MSRGGADPMPQPAAGPGGLVLMTTADGDDRPQRTVVVQPIARLRAVRRHDVVTALQARSVATAAPVSSDALLIVYTVRPAY